MLDKYRDEPVYEVQFEINLAVRIRQSIRISRHDVQLALLNALPIVIMALLRLLAQYFGVPFQ